LNDISQLQAEASGGVFPKPKHLLSEQVVHYLEDKRRYKVQEEEEKMKGRQDKERKKGREERKKMTGKRS
jgi:hypothetical protein